MGDFMKIALINDVHANYEALKVVLKDIKSKKIDKIYSLGDAIGTGYAPSETLDLLIKNNVICLLGNAEAYITMGPDLFPYLKNKNIERYNNAIWTKEKLRTDQIEYIKKWPSSIILDYYNEKIALCHFPLDVRYDFKGVWKYAGENPKELFRINTEDDFEKYNEEVKENVLIASKEPLFEGKTLDNFDRVIFGHHHFESNHKVGNTIINSLSGTGTNIKDKAVYYVLDYKNNKVTLEKVEVPYNYNKVIEELNKNSYPNMEVFKKYIGI